jgi:hypothetical protein
MDIQSENRLGVRFVLRASADQQRQHRGRAGKGFHHAVHHGGLTGKAAREQIDIAPRILLYVLLVYSAEKIGKHPAEYKNRRHRRESPDELPASVRRVTLGGNLQGKPMSPDRPDRK